MYMCMWRSEIDIRCRLDYSLPLCVCVCVCLHLQCAGVYTVVFPCEDRCGGQRLILWSSPSIDFLPVFGIGALSELGASRCLDRLAIRLRGSAHLYVPSAEMTGVCHHAWLFPWVLRTPTRAPCLCSKHFADWAILPLPYLVFIIGFPSGVFLEIICQVPK